MFLEVAIEYIVCFDTLTCLGQAEQTEAHCAEQAMEWAKCGALRTVLFIEYLYIYISMIIAIETEVRDFMSAQASHGHAFMLGDGLGNGSCEGRGCLCVYTKVCMYTYGDSYVIFICTEQYVLAYTCRLHVCTCGALGFYVDGECVKNAR